MNYPERVAIIEKTPREAQAGYMAFCIERCLKEAQLHPNARKQLESLPLLPEGVDLLWALAEKKQEPPAKKIQDPAMIRINDHQPFN